MTKFIDRPRYTCALGGAVGTLQALPRTITIIHGSAGCGGNINAAINAGAGYLGGGYCGGGALPSSNVVEQDVIFGGEDRLREQIESTLEIVDGDLYVVVTGCMVDMIGDDTVNIAREFSRAGKPVIGIPTPSFKGNAFIGYELILQGLIANYIPKREKKDPRTVNLFGIVPAQDVFWKGNLRELKRLLERLGLRVNSFFGEGETLENIRNAGEAGLNIVASNNAGIASARFFEETHGIPWLATPFPIGALAGEKFLRQAGKALSIEEEKIEGIIAEEKEVYYDYFSRVSDIYNDADLQRYAIVLGDSNYAPAITRFISDELGWLPELVVVTDVLEDEPREYVAAQFRDLNSGLRPVLRFDSDASSVKRYLRDLRPRNRNSRYYDAMNPTVILGSSFERDLSDEFGYPLIPVSFPLTGRCVMNRAYAGFGGGLSFAEDALSFLVAAR
jgi:nitrogenase molybdenum-iron protein beta chain